MNVLSPIHIENCSIFSPYYELWNTYDKTDPFYYLFFFNDIQEAAKFAEIHEFGTTDVKDIALKAAALPKKNSKRDRIVVFTQGAEDIIVARG